MGRKKKSSKAALPPKPAVEVLTWPEMALTLLMGLLWVARIAFAFLLGSKLLDGTLLIGANPAWKFILIGTYLLNSLVYGLYVRNFWKVPEPLQTRSQRLSALNIRIAGNAIFVASMVLELTWDYGFHDWVINILCSIIASALVGLVSYFLSHARPDLKT